MFSVSTLKLKESYCIWVFLADENSHKKALKILFQQNFRIFKIRRILITPPNSNTPPELSTEKKKILFGNKGG